MKLPYIITLAIAALFISGCASKEAEPMAEETAPATGTATVGNEGAGEKTAYEGSTGSGLLMERYKSGRIEGYRD